MKKIVLISCASKKLNYKAFAKELYTSTLFKLNMKYAQSLNPDKVFILSAKYGLLKLDEQVEPYNETLNEKTDSEIKKWSEKVLLELKKEADLEKDEIIFLAGERYRRHLTPKIKNYKAPLNSLGIGKQIKFLKEKTDNRCQQLHDILNSKERYNFLFNEEEIPKNGIYVLFQKGEIAHGGDRIVRVGSHTGENQLGERLKQHFINENKDRSIFRKNIGRALLSLKNDPFLGQWEIDLTAKEQRNRFLNSINLEKQSDIEREVTKYIQNNFSFAVIPIKEKRLEIERKIISTISLCKGCEPSESWLGLSSPKEKIRKSGLWLVNELYKKPLSDKDIKKISG